MTKYKSEFLNIMHERGFVHQCSDFDGLDKKLKSGVQSAYIGYDPTGYIPACRAPFTRS